MLATIEIRAVENGISKSFALPGHGFTDRSGGRSGGLSKLCRANYSRNTEGRTSHRVGSRICNNLAVAAGDNDPRSGNTVVLVVEVVRVGSSSATTRSEVCINTTTYTARARRVM